MRIVVDQSPVGAGKTYNALKCAIRSGGRWLIAVERIQSIEELADIAECLRRQFSIKAKVVPISSAPKRSVQKRGDSVRIQVEALPEQYAAGNVIVLVTYEAILKCDFRNFTDWHFVCDEVPSILHIEKMRTKLDRAFFEKHYELQPIHGDWSLIKPTPDGASLTGSDFTQCDSHRRLRKLHETIIGYDDDRTPQAPLCNLSKWSDMESDSVSWVWWSQFSFAHLSSFNSLTVLASRFFDSFAYRIAQRWNPEIDWVHAPPLPVRAFESRSVSVNYFSKKQVATKSFFETATGQKQLSMIGEHVAEATRSLNLIWSANASVKAPLEVSLSKSNYYMPRQAGTSVLMENDTALMIYAAKPSNDVRNVLDAIGASTADWIKTVEHETILQFVTRTSVRDPGSTQPVRIYVYDEKQAAAVTKFFQQQSHTDVDMVFIDLELPSRSSKLGRPKIERTPAEAKIAKVNRQKKRAKQQRARRARSKLTEAKPQQ